MAHRGKVYVIDDDEAMRDSLDFLLGSADFHVTLFESAHHFLDAVSSIDFGCVVSDVRMPGIDGIELLKRMKESHSVFPVLIMTGHGDIPLAVEAVTLDIAARIESLSPRERQVMDGLIAGLSNKLIAREYDISPRTIEVYRANVMTKMQAASLSELVRLAMRAGALKD